MPVSPTPLNQKQLCWHCQLATSVSVLVHERTDELIFCDACRRPTELWTRTGVRLEVDGELVGGAMGWAFRGTRHVPASAPGLMGPVRMIVKEAIVLKLDLAHGRTTREVSALEALREHGLAPSPFERGSVYVPPVATPPAAPPRYAGYLAMAYVPGTGLNEHLARGPASHDEFVAPLAFVFDLAALLAEIHAHAYAHRDIKPGNIVITTRWGRPHPCLVDFGLSRAGVDANGVEMAPGEHGSAGSRFLTRRYAPPEQDSGADGEGSFEAQQLVDIYSLAATAFAVLTGEEPYAAIPESALQARLRDALTAPAKATSLAQILESRMTARGVPTALVAWIMKGMALSPTDRHRGALEAKDALWQALGAITAELREPPGGGPARALPFGRHADPRTITATTRAADNMFIVDEWHALGRIDAVAVFSLRSLLDRATRGEPLSTPEQRVITTLARIDADAEYEVIDLEAVLRELQP